MNKSVVIYYSKYGSAKKYAEWIAGELGCDIFTYKKIKQADMERYDTIVFGGGLYAGGIKGIKLLTSDFEKNSNKKFILFTCGLADPANAKNTDSIKNSLSKVFTPQMQDNIKIFHLRGAIDYSKLSPIHKFMMAMLNKMVKKKDADTLSDEQREMLDTYGKVVDFTDKSSIQPLIDYAR